MHCSPNSVGKVVYNTYRNVKKTSKEDEEYVAELAKAKAKNRIIADRLSMTPHQIFVINAKLILTLPRRKLLGSQIVI